MGGIISRLLTGRSLYDNEIDAIKRRLFAFSAEAWKHNIGIDDIRETNTLSGIRDLINEYDGDELDQMFF